MTQNDSNWKTPVYLIGGLIGSAVGVVSAYLYAKTVNESQPDRRPPGGPNTGELFKLTLALVALVRSISDLGAKKR
ncbi:MAG: hypothetical protein KF726_18845 [Anaerolineae bacterium]|nr:hypothetical protein [Anaerolineae bacterium]